LFVSPIHGADPADSLRSHKNVPDVFVPLQILKSRFRNESAFLLLATQRVVSWSASPVVSPIPLQILKSQFVYSDWLFSFMAATLGDQRSDRQKPLQTCSGFCVFGITDAER